MVSVCAYVCACLCVGVKASVGRGEKTQAIMFSETRSLLWNSSLGYTGLLSRPSNEPVCSPSAGIANFWGCAHFFFFLNMGVWDPVLLPYR